jgi:ribonuclease BN (tRNA processing enzyme)/CTP:molybdopterin cytidylyltransferase MocA
MAVVGVIPAAGHGTRLQPLDCSKEVYPIGGRPVMDHLIERMRAAACDQLRVVTRPEKADVIENAGRHGAMVISARPASLAESLLRGIDGLADDDVVLVGFPDSIWEPIDGYSRVLRLLEEGWDAGLGLFRVDADMRRYEPVVADRTGRVRRIEFKPDHPSSNWLWGCAAAPVAVLRGLEGHTEPGILFQSLAERGVVGSVRLSDRYLDMGTPEALTQAEAEHDPSHERVIVLGSGGWIPTSARQTCSALIRRGSHALVIDAGTGVSRLVENPRLLAGVDSLDVVLTHFHLDHVVGIAYLPALDLPEPPRLHGPGDWLYGRSTQAILERLVGPPLFALPLSRLSSQVSEIRPEGLSVGPFSLVARVQERHDDPTLALRLDDTLTYCTDTAYDAENAEFAAGSRVLLHEAWCSSAAPSEQASHSSAADAARIAAQAGVEDLVLIHIRPGAHEPALLDDARRRFSRSTVGSDLLHVAVHQGAPVG